MIFHLISRAHSEISIYDKRIMNRTMEVDYFMIDEKIEFLNDFNIKLCMLTQTSLESITFILNALVFKMNL